MNREDHTLTGRRAVVTGAGSGIGRATALRLARAGARVAALDVDADTAAATVEEIGAGSGAALAIRADVADESSVAGAVAQAAHAFGGLDALVVNAGIELTGHDGAVHEVLLEVWSRTVAVTLTGAFLSCKHGVAAMLAGARGAAVVIVGSPTGLYGIGRHAHAYSGSKARGGRRRDAFRILVGP